MNGNRRGADAGGAEGRIPNEKVRRRCAALLRAGGFDKNDPRIGTGEADGEEGGDRIRIQICVPEGTIVREARFKAFGCASSIAAASLVAEWLEGRTLAAALEIRSAEIAAELELPSTRLASARLAERATLAAIADIRWKLEQQTVGLAVTEGPLGMARDSRGASSRQEPFLRTPGGSE